MAILKPDLVPLPLAERGLWLRRRDEITSAEAHEIAQW